MNNEMKVALTTGHLSAITILIKQIEKE